MSLPELCVRRPVFATMLVVTLVVLGLFSFHDLGVDLFPKADPATVTVTILLPGASPDEVESSIVEPTETALSGIAGIDTMLATVREGNAQITIQFVLERQLDDAAQDVREKVAAAMRYLPPEVQPPIIEKADPDSFPIYTLVLSSDTMSLRALTEVADKEVSRALQTVDGVGQVTIAGGRAREIHVVVDIEKLSSYGLTVDQVRKAIQTQNIEIPGGKLERGKSEILLRTLGRVQAARQFGTIVIANVKGTPIRVNDIGYVEDTTEDPQGGAWIDGNPAVVLDVRRQSGQNTTTVIAAVKQKMRQLMPVLPKGMKIAAIRDDSTFIYDSISSLEEHLVWGSLLASLVVLLFVRSLPAVIITSLAIPASIIATFTLMRGMDFTLNNMTLLGLTLAVGIVIDDAIVVLENIFRYVEEKGYTPFEAAIQGTREVTLAVMATTLSLVVIFVPIAFMTGYTRRYVNPFGWTMAFAIIVSMFVSFTLTPMLSSRLLKPADGTHKTKENRVFGWMDATYARALSWSLAHRWTVVGVAALVFATTFPLNAVVGRSFIPNEDQSQFTVIVDGPEGTSLEGMTDIVLGLSREIGSVDGVLHVVPTISERPNHSHMQVTLKPRDERAMSQEQIVARVRAMLMNHPAYKPTVIEPSALGGGELGGMPINVNLLGPDLNRVAGYALRLLSAAGKLPTLADMKTTVNVSNPEIDVNVDRERTSDLGVNVADLANALRLEVAGQDEISTYRENGEQYPVKIRVREDQRRDPATIGGLTVPSANGPVRVDSVAELTRGLGPTIIQRFNRQFQIMFMASLKPGAALDVASAQMADAVRKLDMAPSYSARFTGQTKVLDETTHNLVMAFGLASIFMYIVLAAQFESFVQPIVIMLALPLSVPFALLTLWALHRTLNLWSALGILLLLGIVKKNSILQVDYTNVLRRQGVPRDEAILQACRTRLRPILMTTFAILAGLVPTALGLGTGGQQRSAIAVTIIGGQSLCLFLTLLLVPVAYALSDELEHLFVGTKARAWLARMSAATIGRLRPASETR
ncbi:MAG: efflux RND transporter permease subunit [Betaproteobacteria bacterium]